MLIIVKIYFVDLHNFSFKNGANINWFYWLKSSNFLFLKSNAKCNKYFFIRYKRQIASAIRNVFNGGYFCLQIAK